MILMNSGRYFQVIFVFFGIFCITKIDFEIILMHDIREPWIDINLRHLHTPTETFDSGIM